MTASVYPELQERCMRCLSQWDHIAKKMRFQGRNLSGLMMLTAGFACGVVVTLIFGSPASSPTLLEPASTASVPGDRIMLDCRSRLRSCVCDKEAERLKSITRLFLQSHLTVNVSQTKHSTSYLNPHNVSALKKYLYPENPKLPPGVPLGVPKLLKQEYLIKEPLLIGILTQQEYLHTRALAVYETWARDISGGEVVFFVGEDCEIPANLSHMPIIKLMGIPDHVYPPLKKAFAVMQYMYDHFVNQFNWFIRADDDVYMRGELLVDLLKKMSPYERVYLGRAGVGKDDDLDRLHLFPHERYCMGGPGVVFSNAAMRAIGPHLNHCLNAVFLHDKHSSLKWNDDDVEIGRCISRKLDFQCSTSAESRLQFHTDYAGDSLKPLTLWSKPVFREVVSVHPIKDPLNMHAIHHFYKTLEFERQYEELFELMSYTNELCRSLAKHLVPPAFISVGCNLKLSHEYGQENIRSSGSYLVNRSTVVQANPTDIYDDTHWQFFSKDMFHDISATSPQQPLRLSFQAELNHLQNLLTKYFAHKGSMSDYTIEEVMYGHTRFLPATGREFQLQLKFVHKEKSTSVRFGTVRLLRRLSPDISISTESTSGRPIHVLLPLFIVDERFREFLNNFVQQGLSKGITLSLVVVLFSDLDANMVERLVKQVTRGFPKAVVTIAIAEEQYSYPRVIDVGMSVLKSDDLAFVADVNVRMRDDLWGRCRENAIIGQQVYFPIPFSAYVSDYKTVLVNDTYTHPVSDWTGMWEFYSFKTFCIVKKDYADVGGYEGATYTADLFERVMHSRLRIFRAPDPGLYRYWSSKTCESLSSPSKKKACQMFGENLTRFSRPDLTEFLIGQGKSKMAKFWSHNTGD